MNTLKQQIELAKAAYSCAVDAHKNWNALLSLIREKGTVNAEYTDSAFASNAKNAIVAFGRSVTLITEELMKKDAELRRRFDSKPVLEAVIAYNGQTRKVVVGKPNAVVDAPYIMEGYYAAIRAKWGMKSDDTIVSMEDYPILVIDRNRNAVATIEPK